MFNECLYVIKTRLNFTSNFFFDHNSPIIKILMQEYIRCTISEILKPFEKLEQDFFGRCCGKFPEAMEQLNRWFCFFPDGMLQTEIRVLF